MKYLLFTSLVLCLSASAATPPPAPYGATPNALQIKHAERPFYAFCHFSMATFTKREWSSGGESESVFNPTAFDANQIVKAIKASGARGVILTCKHHDGFCLWPSGTTEHDISSSPYQNGKGDMVREFADACKANDFEFGVYVSPWDRNHPTYGSPDYPAVYHKQIEELTTQYGKLFEIWFDGANGGTGYYQGKVGPVTSTDVGHRRSIDPGTYYGWPAIEAILKKNQPEIIVYSDVGPGVRWIGNEHGHAPDNCRATITFNDTDTWGRVNTGVLATGTLNGKVWLQAETDVSLRGSWFFHAEQDPRSPENLMSLYMASIGHGTTFNLNVPPDTRGRVHENDVESLRQFGEHLRLTFAENLAHGAKPKASNTRGGDPAYGPQNLLDHDIWSAWVSDDAVKTPEVTLELKGEKTFNMIRLREDIRLGLRLEGVAVDAWVEGAWKELATATTVGSCRLWQVPSTITNKVRIRVTQAPVAPALSDFGLFLEPEFDAWVKPIGGDLKLAAAKKAKAKWKIVSASTQARGGEAKKAIDGEPGSIWHTYQSERLDEGGLPQDITVDMGQEKSLKGLTYLPRQDGTPNGMVDQYAFSVSTDGKTWKTVSEGEFGNLRANPIEQTVSFATTVKARYFKFTANHALQRNHAVVAEIGVVE